MFSLKKPAADCLDAFYPQVCVSCHQRIAEQKLWLCGTCYDRLSYLPDQICPKCGIPTAESVCPNCFENNYVFTRAVSVFLYEGSAKTLVHALKYEGLTGIADWFGNQMYKTALGEKELAEVDFVTAVPLHRVRRRERGFNQSELIARALASRMEKPFTDKALVRQHYTESQTLLDRHARRKNIIGAFKKGRLNPQGKSFLLIDDVFTTGTTVNEATKTLLNAGAAKVYVMTACHGT
ncbi:MAG: ComF family protein [Candidatus Cloacimonadaceae bacterium]